MRDLNVDQQQVFNDAVRIVREELTPESARIMRYAIRTKSSDAFKMEDRSSFGVAFRNLLAERGIIWEESILFSVWFGVMQQAIMKILE